MALTLEELVAKWRVDPRPSATILVCGALADAAAKPEARSIVLALAREIGEAALLRYPHDPNVLLAAGRMMLAAREVVPAQAIAVQAAKSAPDDPRAYRLLGEVLLRRGDAERAAKALEKATTGGLTDPETLTWVERARTYGLLQYARGVDAVAEAVARDLGVAPAVSVRPSAPARHGSPSAAPAGPASVTAPPSRPVVAPVPGTSPPPRERSKSTTRLGLGSEATPPRPEGGWQRASTLIGLPPMSTSPPAARTLSATPPAEAPAPASAKDATSGVAAPMQAARPRDEVPKPTEQPGAASDGGSRVDVADVADAAREAPKADSPESSRSQAAERRASSDAPPSRPEERKLEAKSEAEGPQAPRPASPVEAAGAKAGSGVEGGDRGDRNDRSDRGNADAKRGAHESKPSAAALDGIDGGWDSAPPVAPTVERAPEAPPAPTGGARASEPAPARSDAARSDPARSTPERPPLARTTRASSRRVFTTSELDLRPRRTSSFPRAVSTSSTSDGPSGARADVEPTTSAVSTAPPSSREQREEGEPTASDPDRGTRCAIDTDIAASASASPEHGSAASQEAPDASDAQNENAAPRAAAEPIEPRASRASDGADEREDRARDASSSPASEDAESHRAEIAHGEIANDASPARAIVEPTPGSSDAAPDDDIPVETTPIDAATIADASETNDDADRDDDRRPFVRPERSGVQIARGDAAALAEEEEEERDETHGRAAASNDEALLPDAGATSRHDEPLVQSPPPATAKADPIRRVAARAAPPPPEGDHRRSSRSSLADLSAASLGTASGDRAPSSRPPAPSRWTRRRIALAILAVTVAAELVFGTYLYGQRRKQDDDVRAAREIVTVAEAVVRRGGPRAFSEAESALARAHKLAPDAPDVALAIARCRVLRVLDDDIGAAGALAEAIDKARRAGANDGDLAFAAIVAAVVAADLAAADAVVARHDGDPEREADPFFQLAAGALLDAKGDARAVDRYAKAIAAKGSGTLFSADVRHARAVLLYGDRAAAQTLAQRLVQGFPKRPETAVLKAFAEVLHPVDGATAVAQRSPVDRSAAGELPRPLRTIGRLLASPELASLGAAIDDADVPGLAMLCAQRALAEGDAALAERAADRALAVSPGHAAASTLKVRLALAAGRVEQIEKAVQGADASAAAPARVALAYEEGDVARLASLANELDASTPAARLLAIARDRLRGVRLHERDRAAPLVAENVPWADVIAADLALDRGDLEAASAVVRAWPDPKRSPARALRLARLLRYEGRPGDAREALAAAGQGRGPAMERVLLATDGAGAGEPVPLDARAGPERVFLEALLAASTNGEAARKRLADAKPPPTDAPLSLRLAAALAYAMAGDAAQAEPLVASLLRQAPTNPDILRAAAVLGRRPLPPRPGRAR